MQALIYSFCLCIILVHKIQKEVKVGCCDALIYHKVKRLLDLDNKTKFVINLICVS